MKLGKYLLAMMMAFGFANVSYADDCCNEEEVAAQTQEEAPAAEETSEASE